MYILEIKEQAKRDIAYYKRQGNKIAIKKIEQLLIELTRHPELGTGHPERLKYSTNMWSRRIDKKNRLVYSIENEIVTVTVVSTIGHYDDK